MDHSHKENIDADGRWQGPYERQWESSKLEQRTERGIEQRDEAADDDGRRRSAQDGDVLREPQMHPRNEKRIAECCKGKTEGHDAVGRKGMRRSLGPDGKAHADRDSIEKDGLYCAIDCAHHRARFLHNECLVCLE